MSGGRAILGDFGYGMIYSTTPSSTSVGSLHYASPGAALPPRSGRHGLIPDLLSTDCNRTEVILKENTYIGPEIDVWSLGCVLFAMVCGFTPFQGDTVRDTKLAIVRGHVDYPSFMSEEVKSLVAHMLDLDPSTLPQPALRRERKLVRVSPARASSSAQSAVTRWSRCWRIPGR